MMGRFQKPGLDLPGLYAAAATEAAPLTASAPLAPTSMPTLTAPMPQLPAQKPSFFGEGGAGRAIAGSIGDALLQQSGMRPIYQPAMQQQRAAQLEQLAYQRKRTDENADWMARAQWERANPAPRYFEANNGDQYVIGPDGKPQKVFADPTPKTEWVNVKNPDGTMTIMPRPQLGPATDRPAIGSVIADPRKAGAGSGQPGFRP